MMHGVSIFFQQVGTQLQTISVLHITIQMYLPYYLLLYFPPNMVDFQLSGISSISSLLKYFGPGHLFRFAHSFNHVDISRHIDKSNEQDPETSLRWSDCEPLYQQFIELQKSGKLSFFKYCNLIVFLNIASLFQCLMPHS